MAQIVCEDLVLGYEGRPVVSGLSFEVKAGDYLCIVGENGSGKSTLIKAILGLQPPMSGRILLQDGLQPSEIGYLPQQTDIQRDFPAQVREIVQSGCLARMKHRVFFGRAEKKLARDCMERMGILDMEKRCYRDLSGGQQQRVLLARALCSAQKVLLLDEPVSGLDPNATLELYQLIRKLNREGITILMVTHDIMAATVYASHILHIGDSVFFGTAEEYGRSRTGRGFLSAEEGILGSGGSGGGGL